MVDVNANAYFVDAPAANASHFRLVDLIFPVTTIVVHDYQKGEVMVGGSPQSFRGVQEITIRLNINHQNIRVTLCKRSAKRCRQPIAKYFPS
jgi:hypothetical protein